MKHEPLVSIVILNWNGTDDTLECIDSVSKIHYNNYEVVVVDNGSSEDISRLDQLTDVKITLVKNQTNLGFTGGEITGLQHSHGDYILILNNDAIIDKNAINEALSVFASDKSIAAVGGRSYLLDDEGNKMGLFHYTHQRIDPVSADVHTYSKDDNEVRDVSNVSGACVLIKRSVIDKVGYFDNSFFAYYEETDLFARFRRAGYRVVFNPNMVIWHKLGASTRNKKYMYNYLMLKNQFFFAYKNFDDYYLKLFKKAYRRHFRRSLMIYAKRLGHVAKHDIIHKARVDAYIKTLVSRPTLRKQRKALLATNPSFSINDAYFTDNPLPISVFIDATNISKPEEKNLYRNLEKIANISIKPSEIIVVSERKLRLPEGNSVLRIANIIDKKISNLSALDFFFMTSNNDMLLFGKNTFFKKDSFNEGALATIEQELKELYTSIAASEIRAIITSSTQGAITPDDLTRGEYDTVMLSKQTLVNHLSDDMYIDRIDSHVVSTTIGRSVAQCIGTDKRNTTSEFFGLPSGEVDMKYEPILSHPVRWRLKYILTKIHAWSIISKILRRLKLIKAHQTNDATTGVKKADLLVASKNTPIIFNTRDRFEPLQKMIKWLKSNGYDNLVFVDNDSTYPPLVDFFNNCPYQVISLGRNAMHKAPWESMAVRFFAKGKPYIVSDPDIVPDPACPSDAISYFFKLLNKYPDTNKVGFGLRIDNLPDSNTQKSHILEWESRYWNEKIELEKDVFAADTDTTFALYRPYTWWFLSPSIRTGGSYVAIHEPWYQSTLDPTEDFMFYKMRASREVSTWGMDMLPKHHRRALKKEGYIEDTIDEEDD